MGQSVLQVWVSQLITNVPDRGPLGTWHLHVSQGLEETTAPGWAVVAAGASERGLGQHPVLPTPPAPAPPHVPSATPSLRVALGGKAPRQHLCGHMFSRAQLGATGWEPRRVQDSWGLHLAQP